MKDTVKKIYFDMDGVLADFEGGAREFCGLPKLDPGQRRTEEEDDLMWQKIREVEHFYDRIKPLWRCSENCMRYTAINARY